MPPSKKVLADLEKCKQIVAAYVDNSEKPQIVDVAKAFGVGHATVSAVLKRHLSPERFRLEKALRYSKSKTGVNNPWWGKVGKDSPRGGPRPCSDKKGHLTILTDSGRRFVHRVVMAEALGVPVDAIPENMHVHHIDGDGENNDLDNLALCTGKAHKILHRKRTELQKSPMWVQMLCGTLK